MLRANPTASHRATEPGSARARGKRHDVVMHALYDVPEPERAAARPDLVRDTVTAWVAGHGEHAGFALMEGCLVADGYRQLRLPRSGGKPMTIACVECEGVLAVTDPISFRVALAEGFGRGRAFGCGLMRIRRA